MVTTRYLLLFAGLTLLSPSHGLNAQESPYTTLASREIKALSEQEIDAYLSGHGMGYALAAELNDYPGPRHALDLVAALDLSSAQVRQITAVFETMRLDAIALGMQIVAAEADLDAAFAAGTLSEANLQRSVVEIGTLQGRLRAVHLSAHLATHALLGAEQISAYSRLRGYDATDITDPEHDSMEHSSHH